MLTNLNSISKRKLSIAALLLITITTLFSGCGKQDTMVLSGTIESTQIDSNSEAAGKVISIEKSEGSTVKKGDVLAVLDSSIQELNVKQQEAVVKLKQAKLDDAKASPTALGITALEADLEQSQLALTQAKLVLEKYKIKAPVDGTYISSNVNVGDMVNIGSSAGTISDLTDLWVNIYVPQRNLNLVRLGQKLDLKSISLPNTTIKGEIVYIASKAEFTPKNTETSEAKENTVFKLKVKILDNLDKLKPGMTVETSIPLNS